MRGLVAVLTVLAAISSPANARELLPGSAIAGSAQIFASSRGLDVFWTAQPKLGASQFAVMYRRYTMAGAPIGKPTKLLDQPGRAIAAGEPGTFALAYQVSTSAGWEGHVRVVRPDDAEPIFDVALPNAGRGHGTLAIGWDPRHEQWVVAGEQLIQLPDQPIGYVYNRLFVARLDTRGGWIEKPHYVSEPGASASLSDWADAMTWAGDRMAVAWTATRDHDASLYVTELEPGRATRLSVATGRRGLTRCAIAATRAGYILAGAESGDKPLESHVFVTRLRDGVAEPLTYISAADRHGGEVVIASDGARAAISWNEDEIAGENVRTSVHVAIVDARGAVRPAFASATPRGRHDWTQAIAWDGTAFALVHTIGINPSAMELVRLSGATVATSPDARPALAR